jgi:hypothetical protein
VIDVARMVQERIPCEFAFARFHRSALVPRDTTKVQRALGYRPSRTIESAIDEVKAALVDGRIDDEDPRCYNIRHMKTLVEIGGRGDECLIGRPGCAPSSSARAADGIGARPPRHHPLRGAPRVWSAFSTTTPPPARGTLAGSAGPRADRTGCRNCSADGHPRHRLRARIATARAMRCSIAPRVPGSSRSRHSSARRRRRRTPRRRRRLDGRRRDRESGSRDRRRRRHQYRRDRRPRLRDRRLREHFARAATCPAARASAATRSSGTGVVTLPDAEIGDDAIVGAGAVVVKTVERGRTCRVRRDEPADWSVAGSAGAGNGD